MPDKMSLNIVSDLSDSHPCFYCRDVCYQFGEIRSISIAPKQQCAFLQFTTRFAAEQAAEALFGKLIIKGQRVNVRWGKPQGAASSKETIMGLHSVPNYEPVPGLPGMLQRT